MPISPDKMKRYPGGSILAAMRRKLAELGLSVFPFV